MINVKDETGFSKRIAARQISIADDGFASIIGIGRIPLAGLTQFEAEDLPYERLVMDEINPEFELFISRFNSQKIYITYNQSFEIRQRSSSGSSNDTNIMEFQYTNSPIYINEILAKAKVFLHKRTRR